MRIKNNYNNHLHVETDGGDCSHNLAKLEFVQDGGLASSVETNHQNTHVLLAEAIKQFAEEVTHL